MHPVFLLLFLIVLVPLCTSVVLDFLFLTVPMDESVETLINYFAVGLCSAITVWGWLFVIGALLCAIWSFLLPGDRWK